jgi:hypothetical protein
MKMTPIRQEVKPDEVLDICVDVSKDKLNVCFDLADVAYDDEFANTTRQIEKRLKAYHHMAQGNHITMLRIICEPSGGYQNKLLATARRLGYLTAYVNGEAVAKFRVVETNDSGKTDLKDPHIIQTLARVGKTLTHRLLPDDYLVLRRWSAHYDDVEERIVQLKVNLHHTLKDLFCDYTFKKDFLYGKTGQTLVDSFGCNPYRMIKAGYHQMVRRMRKSTPTIQTKTLKRLWQDAICSVRNQLPMAYIELLEQELQQAYDEYRRYKQRQAQIKREMITIVDRLREADPNIPAPTKGVITAIHLARLLAETGPLADFGQTKQLLRYAGLNIRMRQSGTYKGQYKISKKGRPRLRHILAKIVLPLVRRDRLYGPFYHEKRKAMCGIKAMTVVMRHVLRKLLGWYKSGKPFDKDRFFLCQSQYQLQNAA